MSKDTRMSINAEDELTRILLESIDRQIIKEIIKMRSSDYINQKIRLHDESYKLSKESGNYNMSADSLMNSIMLRRDKIIKSHCE